MESKNWKLHAQRGWGLASAATAMFAALLVNNAIEGESMLTSALTTGCTAGLVVWLMSRLAQRVPTL